MVNKHTAGLLLDKIFFWQQVDSKKFVEPGFRVSIYIYAPCYRVSSAKSQYVPPLFTCTDCYWAVDLLESVGNSAKKNLEKFKLLVIIGLNYGIIISIKIGIEGAR